MRSLLLHSVRMPGNDGCRRRIAPTRIIKATQLIGGPGIDRRAGVVGANLGDEPLIVETIPLITAKIARQCWFEVCPLDDGLTRLLVNQQVIDRPDRSQVLNGVLPSLGYCHGADKRPLRGTIGKVVNGIRGKAGHHLLRIGLVASVEVSVDDAAYLISNPCLGHDFTYTNR